MDAIATIRAIDRQIDEVPKCGGVYAIVNLRNSRAYIGQTCRLTRRFHEHKSRLRGGTHANKELQNEWDEFGESSFVFHPLLLTEDRKKRFEEEALIAHSLRSAGLCLSFARDPELDAPFVAKEKNTALFAIRCDEWLFNEFHAPGRGSAWARKVLAAAIEEEKK